MYRHILIPTDGSDLSLNAIDHGMALAKSVNAKVTVVTVSPPFNTFAVEPDMITETREHYEADGDPFLQNTSIRRRKPQWQPV